MRTVNNRELAAMPNGTVYAELPRGGVSCGPLSVKVGDTLADNDWVYVDFDTPDFEDTEQLVERVEAMRHDSSVSWPVDTSSARDGCYDDNARYVVYDADDVARIVACLTGGYE